MAGSIPNNLRDQLITGFRYAVAEKNGITPFPHQAAWWAASDGAILLDVEAPEGMNVRLGDGSIQTRAMVSRPGGRAKVIADLGAFKIGKSFSSALWASAFACVPNARVQLVGLEYDICAPEFEYLIQFLCSESGMGMTPSSIQNRPRDGRMWLEFENGARFEAKSWERKDTMKGKEIDCYLYCEAYMLPGLECYTSFSQNLRARDGYAVFATTPDRPWVNEIHNAAHSGQEKFKAWHCTCSVHSSQNPYTFSQEAMERDKDLMTREKYAIHYEGKLGDFVGRVYAFQRGERVFNKSTHPILFGGGDGSRADFVLPDGWELVGGADTGTNTSAVLIAFSPQGDAFVVDEFPNYAYIAGSIERDDTITIPQWCRTVLSHSKHSWFWADTNSQWKKEVSNYGMVLQGNKIPLETRTEITREYFQHNRIWLAPWLKVLPFELENACWPEASSASGKFQRIKDRDHTLDCVEHILSKRPQGKWAEPKNKSGTWLEGFIGRPLYKKRFADPHLGEQ